jgi:hypothetical protein
MWQIRVVGHLVCACIAALVVAPVSEAEAVCLAPQQQVPAEDVLQFLGNPEGLLHDPAYSSGGARMIARIRDLIASNRATFNVIFALIAKANPEQQTAIGTGSAQAALVCVKSKPTRLRFSKRWPVSPTRTITRLLHSGRCWRTRRSER